MSTDETSRQAGPTLPGATDSEKCKERQQAIAEGIALIGAGNSERYASRAVGVPKTTLHDAYLRVRSATSDQERETLDQELIGYAIVNASLAAQELGRRLSDPPRLAKISERDLNVIYGVHVDKLALKRRWSRPEDQGAEGWLGQLAQGLSRLRRVTIELPDPVEQAVDVSPTSQSSE